MTDIEAARRRWLEERAKYELFGKLVEERLSVAVQKEGIWCETTSRAKEQHSLVKKILKGKHTYDTLPDKVGARCVVRYLSDAEKVVALACQLFDSSEIDRKLDKLVAEDRVGYSGIHVQVHLKHDDKVATNFPPAEYSAELQVKTLAQRAWSEMTHDSIYKNEETIEKLPPGARRRASLMAALIEVADREFDRLNKEAPLGAAAEVYMALERHYFKLSARRPDPELSLEVIDLLVPLYGQVTAHEIADRLSQFFTNHENTLHSIYAGAMEITASAFLYQPEALMIYERLEADQLATRKVWNTRFPETELERIANSFGISFD